LATYNEEEGDSPKSFSKQPVGDFEELNHRCEEKTYKFEGKPYPDASELIMSPQPGQSSSASELRSEANDVIHPLFTQIPATAIIAAMIDGNSFVSTVWNVRCSIGRDILDDFFSG
jgi:hypothetical protein